MTRINKIRRRELRQTEEDWELHEKYRGDEDWSKWVSRIVRREIDRLARKQWTW